MTAGIPTRRLGSEQDLRRSKRVALFLLFALTSAGAFRFAQGRLTNVYPSRLPKVAPESCTNEKSADAKLHPTASATPEQKQTILFVSMVGQGHINACINVADILARRGHRIVFAVEAGWAGSQVKTKYDWEEYEYGAGHDLIYDREFSASMINKYRDAFRTGNLTDFMMDSMFHFMNAIRRGDGDIKKVIATVKPDLIIVDQFVCVPSIEGSGIPYIWLYSSSPSTLFPRPRNQQPGCVESLIPASNIRPSSSSPEPSAIHPYKWPIGPYYKPYVSWAVANGCRPLKGGATIVDSPYLNIYTYPKALEIESFTSDHDQVSKLWFRMDANIRDDAIRDFQLPEAFLGEAGERRGKIGFLSMGSFASGEVGLMKRLIGFLHRSKHYFIVSLGPMADQYVLPPNVYGENFIDQLSVLKIVDFAVLHGGHNSFCESLYFGVPMILLPLFSDQHANAARVSDLGVGKALKTYSATEAEFSKAIDDLLNDTALHQRLKTISEEMHEKSNLEEAASRIEAVGRMRTPPVHQCFEA